MTGDIKAILRSDTELSQAQIVELLDTEDEALRNCLMEEAYRVKLQQVGKEVYLRGIIEFSNRCSKDCFYCGIRRSNRQVERFTMPREDIIRAALWAHDNRYGSLVLQAGERQDKDFVGYVEGLIQEIKETSQGELGITLSLGEQSESTYQRWFQAGAHRYLLRIETSNTALYKKLHPQDHDPTVRHACIATLRSVGYQVGTGVMIGLPGQSSADLARDIAYFKTHDIDMIGMGPYIVHQQTPMGAAADDFNPERQVELSLRMIALTRIMLKDVNIAATTALQALHPQGREMGLQAGANIIMPNITDTQYRAAYQLYEGKPCMDENASLCRNCLDRRVTSIGESIGLGKWGDSPHFALRTKEAGQS